MRFKDNPQIAKFNISVTNVSNLFVYKSIHGLARKSVVANFRQTGYSRTNFAYQDFGKSYL